MTDFVQADDFSDYSERSFHVRNHEEELSDSQNGRNVRRNVGNHVITGTEPFYRRGNMYI